MREPRYQFPNHVRDTTRAMAERMDREGTVARTPDELEAWIDGEPEVRASLESGGYGTHFTAADLFPLLEAMLTKRGARPAGQGATGPGAAARSPARWWVAIVVAVVLLVLVLLLTAAETAPAQDPGSDPAPPPAVLMQGEP
jgi:hypothetical protein